MILIFSAPVFATQLSFKPSLEVRETYTDNVALTDSGEEDLITEINPGIVVQADGDRLNANLGYTLQNRFYAKNSSRNDRFHNLTADGLAELVRDFAFLNLRASNTQRGTSSAEGALLDNLNTTNRTEVSAWTINPYLKKRFGRSAEGLASYSFESRRDGQGVSDTEIEAIQIEFESGPSFRKMAWSMDYSSKAIRRETASNDRRESFNLRTRYQVNSKLGALFRAGTVNNNLATSQNRDFKNGSYYAVGVSIMPHSTLQIDLLLGDKLDYASFTWIPTSRSSLDVSREKKKVGLNPDRVVWNGNLRLTNRRMSWIASYTYDTTSVSESTSIVPLPLSDGLFDRKRTQMNWEYKTAKSRISVDVYQERREFRDNTTDTQKLNGGEISWRWRFATRTDMKVNFQRSDSDYSSGAGTGGRGGGEFRRVDINFSRKMGQGMEGSVMAQNTSWDGLAGGRSYDENRLSVGVKWVF